ncbi:MAG: AzlC family ABC transporter permease [Ilumatobacter sp.]
MGTLIDSAHTAANRRGTASLRIQGARDITPMVIGAIPFALAIGAAISSSSLTTVQGLITGPLFLAGAAQIATVQMIDDAVSPAVIIASALVINARVLLYSASLAPWFPGQPLRRRLLIAAPVIDQLHFTCTPRFQRRDLDVSERLAYYTGAAVWMAVAWTLTQAIGVFFAHQIPAELGLDIAAPLALVGLLAKSAVNRSTVIASGVSGTVAVLGVGLPLSSATLIAIIAGVAVTARRET